MSASATTRPARARTLVHPGRFDPVRIRSLCSATGRHVRLALAPGARTNRPWRLAAGKTFGGAGHAINVLTSDEPALPGDGAVFHDTAIWMRPETDDAAMLAAA